LCLGKPGVMPGTQQQVEKCAFFALNAFNLPDGHFKFLHLWPPQTPPGRTVEVSVV
jgi:hypothetical protein